MTQRLEAGQKPRGLRKKEPQFSNQKRVTGPANYPAFSQRGKSSVEGKADICKTDQKKSINVDAVLRWDVSIEHMEERPK